MRVANKIWDSGWGAIFLTIYSVVAVYLLLPESKLWMSTAGLLPTVLVMFSADYFNERLLDFFAGGELRRSTDEIDELTGDNHFYEAAPEEVQTRVDKFDRRAYQHNITFLTGLIIAVTAPIIGYFLYDFEGAGGGLLLSLIALQGLSRRSIRQLNSLAGNITDPYQAKYENQ